MPLFSVPPSTSIFSQNQPGSSSQRCLLFPCGLGGIVWSWAGGWDTFHHSAGLQAHWLALRGAGAPVPSLVIPELCRPCPNPQASISSASLLHSRHPSGPAASALTSLVSSTFFLLFVLGGLSLFVPILPFPQWVWAGMEESDVWWATSNQKSAVPENGELAQGGHGDSSLHPFNLCDLRRWCRRRVASSQHRIHGRTCIRFTFGRKSCWFASQDES